MDIQASPAAPPRRWTDVGWSLLKLVLLPERSTANAAVSVAADLRLSPRVESFGLAGLLLLALAARVSVAALFPSFYHPDEVFQYWEQGYRLVFGQGIIPWEYRDGIRSFVMPGFIAGIIWTVHALGGDGQAWRLAVQATLSLVSLSVVATAYFWARRAGGISAGLLAGFVAAVWFETVFFSARPLTEIAAAAFLFPAAYLLCAIPRPRRRVLFAGGLLLGLAVVLRIQLLPVALTVVLASALHVSPRRIGPQVTAALVVLLASGVLDWITLGTPFQSVWKYVEVNVIKDKASSFGTQPVFWYFFFYANAWAGFIVPMLCLFAVGARRAPLLLTLPLVLVLSHSLIGHKEYRFIYPALPFLLTVASIGAMQLYRAVAAVFFPRGLHFSMPVLGAAWLLTSIALACQDGFRPRFVAYADPIAAFQLAGRLTSLCGLALGGLLWVNTPGYSGLGRDVPLYHLNGEDEATALEPAYNVIVRTDIDWPVIARDYRNIGCTGGVCVDERPGKCVPAPGKTVNDEIAAANE